MHFWHNTFAKLLQHNIEQQMFLCGVERHSISPRSVCMQNNKKGRSDSSHWLHRHGLVLHENENLSARCDDFCNAAKLMLEILRLWSAPGSGQQSGANVAARTNGGEARGWRRFGKRMKRTPHRHCNHYNECSVSAKWIIHVVYVPRKTISIVSTQQTKLFNRNRKRVNESLAALRFICYK